jgi:dihydropteroate synthase-like protein
MTTGVDTAGALDSARFPNGWRGLRVLFVTGRLAEALVRRVAHEAAPRFRFTAEVRVLGISVAALMHIDWVRRKLTVDATAHDLVLLPGWCQGDVRPLEQELGLPVVVGPKEIQDLPEWLGGAGRPAVDLSRADIEIVAEINRAPRLAERELVAIAERYRGDGADVIDVGCIPGESWQGVGAAVRRLRELGLRVSIDSFDRAEVEAAVASGAELVLSCNASNRDWAKHLPAELVAIPDDPARLETLDPTVRVLEAAGAKFRLDPILEPIGFGFTASLARYYRTRERYPDRPMLMGIGNVTELAQADSAGMHLLLAAICQELRIGSVLTTEVANWCRGAVREFDLARRLVRHAVTQRTLVKRLPESLLLLRDVKVTHPGEDQLAALAAQITDPNVRLFVDGRELHLINRDGRWRGTDPFEVFERFLRESPGVDASHAFYLGYELAKATTALMLGKQYSQDQPLNWGFLSQPESSRHERAGG